jgi:hypothetical protein
MVGLAGGNVKMNVRIHEVQGKKVAEMLSDGIIIRNTRDAVDLIGQMLSRGLKQLILHERNVAPEFFQLGTGIAGEVLQKLTNYQIKVAFVGQFDGFKSKSLQAFIVESNRGNQVCFTNGLDSALERMGSS